MRWIEYAIFTEEFIQCCFLTNEAHSTPKNGVLFQRNINFFTKLISKKYQHNRRLFRTKHWEGAWSSLHWAMKVMWCLLAMGVKLLDPPLGLNGVKYHESPTWGYRKYLKLCLKLMPALKQNWNKLIIYPENMCWRRE